MADHESVELPKTARRKEKLPPLIRITSDRGAEVCTRCEVAQTAWARMRGLLGRDGVEPGGGLLINGTGSIHMFFMRFPIDVVFLDRDRKILGIAHEVRPWRTAATRRAVAALELPAGTAKAHDLAVGDTLAFEPAQESSAD